MEAAVILTKCPKYKKVYGMRVQKMPDNDWWRTWTFPIDEKRAHREGYDVTRILGNLNCTDDYPGCPYCGAMGFVECGRCGKLSCWSGEKSVKCEWCGVTMTSISVNTEKFSLKGGDI